MNINSSVIDFHSHILPSVDHGCKDIKESTDQFSLIRENKTNIIVATPHFYPHVHIIDSFISKVDNAISALEDTSLDSTPLLHVGAEVLVCENLCDMDGLDRLCIRGTKTLLLELPLNMSIEKHYNTVEQLLSDDYTVVCTSM